MKKGRRKAAEAPGFQRSSRQPQIDMTASDSSRRQRGEPNKAILRTRKADQTEQAIMDAAISFFWNHSFRDLSVKKLMEDTPVSRAAFYQYFVDVYQLMEVLLDYLRQDILTAAGPWLADEGDPVEQLNTSLHGLVHTAYRNGPLLRAISDAAATDARLESSWTNLLLGFDALVANKIQQHQKLKLIGPIDAHSVAVALNRMDAYLFIHHFGRLPRSEPKLVWNAIRAIWLSTLYGVAASDVP
ncbi:TetR/AcrR family transcriptional regulator [bacterium]|jgi:AcrR family transcriptional regulator|nr:TetR/AcrR family transcriptional regulator [bacterium]